MSQLQFIPGNMPTCRATSTVLSEILSTWSCILISLQIDEAVMVVKRRNQAVILRDPQAKRKCMNEQRLTKTWQATTRTYPMTFILISAIYTYIVDFTPCPC